MSPWIILFAAGILEIVWAAALKASDGFSHPGYTAVTILGAIASFWLLGWAMKDLPLGTAYGVWVGIGVAGTAILGIVWFADPLTTLRLTGLGLIVTGVITLKLAG